MKKLRIFILIAGFAALAFQGCTPQEVGMEPGTFEIDEKYMSFNFTQDQETVFIPVRTNIPAYEWECTSTDESWCKLAGNYGNETGLLLAVTSSDEPEVRKATATVSAGAKEYTITVAQLGYGPAILVSNQAITAAGGAVAINVTSNIEYMVSNPVLNEEDDEDWFAEQAGVQPTKAFAQSSYSYYAQANLLPFERSATVNFVAVAPEYSNVSATCTVTQGTGNVTPGGSGKNDQKVTVLTVSASHAQDENSWPSSNMIDGDYTNDFEGPWEPNDNNPFNTNNSLDLEFTFAGTENIDYVTIYHNGAYDGSAGRGNGRIGEFDVYYKNADNPEYVKVTNPNTENGRYNFNREGGIQTAYFPYSLVNATAIKIAIWDGTPGTPGNVGAAGNVAIAEVEFYHSFAADLQAVLGRVFTDLSCSELKDGVTRSDITALYEFNPYLAQVVAAALMEGTYPEDEAEFRIHSYEAYSSNTKNVDAGTRIYTRQDNPTGVYVEAGDQMMVCVDKIPAGHTVGLAVYGEASNGYGPNYGGMGTSEGSDQEISLQAGVNTFNITANGMLYVINTASNLTADSEPVKVHVLPGCGDIEGYFDLARHTDEDYVRMLRDCDYKYFMIKGKNIMFNFHVSQLRIDAPNGITSGITAWDEIVGWQHELMGLDKIDWYNNHMMAVTSADPTAYMDASNRRVNFANSALYKIISREALLAEEDNTWGPAHELGHIHQQIIDWKGSSESSNNLFSNYVIYKFGKYGSRGDKLSELADAWVAKRNWELLGSSTHQNEDTELHMRMNWQLWIYYHRCGFKEDFWPTLFGLLREDRLPNGNLGQSEDLGQAMLKFVEKACDAAGEDLTEFFETWGFFVPIDQTIEQYGSARCYIDEDMVTELKAKIAAKNYPKAAPIQYIEDRNTKDNEQYSEFGYFESFLDKTKTVSSSASCTLEGRTYRTTNCTNAVAIEVRKAPAADGTLGELVYFSNFATFTVPDAAGSLTGLVAYAVEPDGDRVRLN